MYRRCEKYGLDVCLAKPSVFFRGEEFKVVEESFIYKRVEALGLALDEPTIGRIGRYLALLESWNKVYNITSHRKAQEMLEDLVFPSLAISKYLPKEGRFLDLGSGGGVPGLVLAMSSALRKWTLVEKVAKKSAFLRECVYREVPGHVEVWETDFHSLPVDLSFTGIVTRGSGTLKDQLRWTKGWRVQGVALYSVQTKESLGRLKEGERKYIVSPPECVSEEKGLYLLQFGADS